MNHDELKILISAYFDGEATAQEKELAEKHLSECATCREHFVSLHKLSASLKKWTDENLSPDLEVKMKTKWEREEHKMDNKRNLFKVGSVVVVIFFLGVVSLQTYTQRSLKGRMKAATQVIDQLKAANTATTQYEPYYLSSQPVGTKGRSLDEGKAVTVEYDSKIQPQLSMRTKVVGGFEQSVFKSENLDAKQESWGSRVDAPVVALNKEKGGLLIYPATSAEHQVTQSGEWNTEGYDRIYENEFLEVKENALSTFSIDVDTASYSNIRRYLNSGSMPPKDAVRIEEMVNYFTYDYPQPQNSDPFSITTEVATCPWNEGHNLVLIGLQGMELDRKNVPASNLVFLIDVSGSMDEPNKLPLLKSAFKMMVNQLRTEETIAIVTYAGNAGLVLDSTPGSNKQAILEAIDRMQAGGSTAGGQGIQLAYQVAKDHFIKGGNNRVILATDGDFNVGVSSDGELTRIIEDKRKDGIFLTVLGFGTGNYKDSKMEKLADKGNGNYYYIDTINEAKKVLVNELGSMLFAIAKDVKIQIEFNPAQVKAYRLIGYENRMLAKEDFNDDTKDAGELGAGHTVTALYEIVPALSNEKFGNVDGLVYQKTSVSSSEDLLTVKFRYKKPDEDKSNLITQVLKAGEATAITSASENLKFTSSVAEFGLLLRDSKFKGSASYQHAAATAKGIQGKDTWGYRAELINLIEKASVLSPTVNSEGGYQFKK